MSKRPKTNVISVRMPLEKCEAIEKAAVDTGTSVSAFVRSAVERAMDNDGAAHRSPPTLNAPDEPLPVASGISLSDPAALAELKRIGINVNQIAHGINAGLPQNAQRIVGAVREMFDVLAKPDAFRDRLADLEPLLARAIAGETKPPAIAAPVPPAVTAGPRPLPVPAPITEWKLNPPQMEHRPPVASQPEPMALPRVLQPPTASAQTEAARRRALLATNTIRRPVKPPQPSDQDTDRDPPHPQARQQLQGSPELRPARSGQPDRPPSRLGLLGKLWNR